MNNRDGLEVTDAVANGQRLSRALGAINRIVILMDVRMLKWMGCNAPRLSKKIIRRFKIIILTTFDDDEYVYNALKNGASGYLLKGVTMDELVSAIETVHSGRAMINPDIATKVVKLFSQMAKADYSIQVGKRGQDELTKTEWKIIEQVDMVHPIKKMRIR